MIPRRVLFIVVSVAVGVTAMSTASAAQKPGDKLIDAYLAQEAEGLAAGYLAGVQSAADWKKLRGRLHQEYLDMLGLWPMPRRTPLKPKITGTLKRDGIVVEKLHFQSRPGLYVTANLYRPKKQTGRLPGVLYVCGHAGRGPNGNKTAFQHHGMWFATHGYVCLITDTLQLGEIAAIHHGTYRYDRWWWHSRGYTSAGVECWNSIRAIDYLQSRPEVDPDQIAVTGISGGGACTFWVTSADPRVKAAVPVSGMGDLDVYVTDRVVNGHCDCMFLYNFHQWPWTYIAALVAPRPMLFANSDKDGIFPMDGNDRVIARLRKLYKLLGKGDLVDACVSKGGHKDRIDLRLAAYRWINKHIKGDDRKVTEPKLEPFKLGKLRVFDGKLPADQLNTKIDQTFVPIAKPKLPADKPALQTWRKKLLADLRARCFAGWPKQYPRSKPPALGKRASHGLFVTAPPLKAAWRYFPGVGRALPAASRALPAAREAKTCWLVVLNQDESDEAVPEWARQIVGDRRCVVFSPRGVGPTAWTIKKPWRIRRSLALLGRTVDSGRIWDVMAFAKSAAGTRGVAWHVTGRGRAGVIAAYAALFEPSLSRVVLVEPPRSHADGPHFLGVLRVTDVPVSLGLLAPRPLTIRGVSARAFARTARLYRAAGAADRLQIEK